MLIFELSRKGRRNPSQAPHAAPGLNAIPDDYRRTSRPLLPEVSELDAVRHYTNLSRSSIRSARAP
jgi:glycine dehydrogenase subunit 2